MHRIIFISLALLAGCMPLEHIGRKSPDEANFDNVESAGPDANGVVCYHLKHTDYLSCVKVK